ncbi:Zinc finger protein, partial [Plakobranchus ocellatus]
TRYEETVPLRKIDAEANAEALVDIYSRLGILEKVLSEQGMQLMSDCIKEVCRFLGIKQKSNKLLVQWREPFRVSATVGANDYRSNVNGEEKTFQTNLLKRYITMDTTSDETPRVMAMCRKRVCLLWRTTTRVAAVMTMNLKFYRS